MASSSKVMFNLETLKAKALESMDTRIALKEERLAGMTSTEHQDEVIRAWRDAQESKISDVFSQLGEGGIDDYRLSRFKLDPYPEFDDHDIRRTQRDLERLRGLRSQIIAKTESLVPDEQGSISLTKTQLAEFFGL